MRKFHFLAICVLANIAIGGCATKPIIQSQACAKGDPCRSLGGYSIPSIVLDYTVARDSAGVVEVAVNERAIPAAWVPLGYLPGMSSDDSITYELENGFLKSVGSIADDKSATVVAEILKIATAPVKPPGAKLLEDPKALAFTLDVTKPEAAVALLADQLGLCIKAEAQGLPPDNPAIVATATAAPGIYYPVERHWRVIIWDPGSREQAMTAGVCTGAAVGKLLNDRTELIPMSNKLARVDIDRTKWVKHEVTVSFDKGRLTKVDLKKPSEAAAFASIPADVLKTIVGIPAELVQFKIDTSGKDKALAVALKAQLEADQAYIKALEDAKAAQEAKAKKAEEDSAAEPVVDAPPQ
jgi:hypothetical protein